MKEQSQETTVFKYLTGKSNYDKYPYVRVTGAAEDCSLGWSAIGQKIQLFLEEKEHPDPVIVVETYQGVLYEDVLKELKEILQPALTIDTKSLFLTENEISGKIDPCLGDHPIFGFLGSFQISDFMDSEKIQRQKEVIQNRTAGLTLIYGPGAHFLASKPDVFIYTDMARWEIQQRMRRHEVDNLGFSNREESAVKLYKQAYFIDWRICDKHKMSIMHLWDFVLDTNDRHNPKMVAAKLVWQGLEMTAARPFRVVPFFDPGVWGGQWMKEVCDLDPDEINYAWCFDCVPEENSLLLGFGNHRFEIPSINLVLSHPSKLLGQKIYEQFGAEFPIRFDFLDTMDGGNLSLQVHPFKQYMQENFGLHYTQDESYYLLEVEPDAVVYLGLKEKIDRAQMIHELKLAESGDFHFDADKFINKWPVKKHDHILIPAGTIHCSGKNSMVLEISATPYIFTFKLWDWGRVDFNGQPRTISLEHGLQNIQWDRDTEWTKNELINQTEIIAEGEGWREEVTGLHPLEFIETRRHWFTSKVTHDTDGNLNILNLVEGREILVESPTQAFEPFIVHYAETFIVPAAVGVYTITPYGESAGQECATIKAFVR